MVTEVLRNSTSEQGGPLTWESFAAEAKAGPAWMQQVATWLDFIRVRLKRVRTPRVLHAFAYGRAFDSSKPRRRASWDSEGFLKLVVVTDQDDALNARWRLGVKVFGPAFNEFLHLPDVDVWTRERYRLESECDTAIIRSLRRGIVLVCRETGAPP